MKLLAVGFATLVLASPSKTVTLQIVHAVRGCHIWQSSRDLGPATVVRLRRGDRIVLRVSCPMDFRLTQVRGPKLALGDPVVHTGTQRTLAFKRPGVYVLSAANLQSSADVGLQTLGPDATLTLTVRVR